jgi:hypothetical protein
VRSRNETSTQLQHVKQGEKLNDKRNTFSHKVRKQSCFFTNKGKKVKTMLFQIKRKISITNAFEKEENKFLTSK